MDSMNRMTTGQGLEEESGETGDQVARLEVSLRPPCGRYRDGHHNRTHTLNYIIN